MSHSAAKRELLAIIDSLPDTAAWADAMREVFVRVCMADGMSEQEASDGYSEHAVFLRLMKAAE
jgi:hypothetical protein